jgi:hypothetical protein
VQPTIELVGAAIESIELVAVRLGSSLVDVGQGLAGS